MIATGRLSIHIASWRGPCTIVDRLSSTAYAMTEDATGRRFERVLTNILPYRAVSARTQAAYDPATSGPFVLGEIVAVRDDPSSPYYLASAIQIAASNITVHYFGCTQRDIQRATFRPAYHFADSDSIILSATRPADSHLCTGIIEFDSLRELLVARNLQFTNAKKTSQEIAKDLAPTHDGLFVFDD
jgi:hypothetical protein